MNNRHVYTLAGALIFFGLVLMLGRFMSTGLPLTPGETTPAWLVEREIQFEANGQPVKLAVKMPRSTDQYTITGEWVVANRYATGHAIDRGERILNLANPRADGPQTIYLRALLHPFSGSVERRPVRNPGIVESRIKDEEQLVAARNLLEMAESQSDDDATLVTALIGMLPADAQSKGLTINSSGQSVSVGRAQTVGEILSLRAIAARQVNGLALSDEGMAVAIRHWVEVYISDQWIPYSLEDGTRGLPASHLPIWRGADPMVTIEGADNPRISVSIRRPTQGALDQAITAQDPLKEKLTRFSLHNLPPETQQVFRVLLVVPLGIIALVIIRNVIGIKSLGTFMPVLIAMALHSTSLIWGAAVFAGIVTAGLLFRFYLEKLKLLLVPRLASVLIFVIILMAVLTMVADALGLAPGLSIALFPMVIMTMTIERLSILWDERGATEAMQQGFSSLVIAALLCILMSFPIFEHVFFTFPELLLVLLAIALLLGRYRGYRLLELLRFRAFNE